MIPKIIHYCWFSGEDKPEIIKSCIQTWKDKLTNYEIIEWTTTEFDVKIIPFTEQAYANKKWAFVADYFRLWVLYNYGGIYLDSDVILNKTFDKYLNGELFMVWENLDLIGAHIFGSEKNNIIIKLFMDYYERRDFIDSNDNLDLIPMPQIITKILRKNYDIRRNGKLQKKKDYYTIYPMNYFTIDINDDNNICNHLFLGSWNNNSENYLEKMHHHYHKYYSTSLKNYIYLFYKLGCKLNIFRK